MPLRVQAIVPAAGSGTRLSSISGRQPKTLLTLQGKPLIVYALEALQQCPLIEKVVLVVPADHKSSFPSVIRQYALTKVTSLVEGGATRSASVAKGLKQIDAQADMVVVHDGCRPLVSRPLIEAAIALCRKRQAVVAAVPVKATIKRVKAIKAQEAVVRETLPRDELWEIQTPQVFSREILVKAYGQAGYETATDCASLVERLGIEVAVLQGDYRNIKVTTPEDVVVAEALLVQSRKA